MNLNNLPRFGDSTWPCGLSEIEAVDTNPSWSSSRLVDAFDELDVGGAIQWAGRKELTDKVAGWQDLVDAGSNSFDSGFRDAAVSCSSFTTRDFDQFVGSVNFVKNGS